MASLAEMRRPGVESAAERNARRARMEAREIERAAERAAQAERHAETMKRYGPESWDGRPSTPYSLLSGSPHRKSYGANLPAEFPFEVETRKMIARVNKKFADNVASYGDILPMRSCIVEKVVTRVSRDGTKYSTVITNLPAQLTRLSKAERATLADRPIRYSNDPDVAETPEETPIAYVGAEIADAFGMRGMPNVVVTEAPPPDDDSDDPLSVDNTDAERDSRAVDKMIRKVSSAKSAPTEKRLAIPQTERDALRRAYVAVLAGRVSQQSGDYFVTDKRKQGTRIAPWNSVALATYPTIVELGDAARKWMSPKNAGTLRTHGVAA